MNTAIIIPARLASQRFPRKLLFEVLGKPLILWTAERVKARAGDLPLWFAVAEEELADLLQSEGYQTVLTDPDLPSGTDRLAQANETVKADAVINIQADEPLVAAEHIQALHEWIRRDVDLATLATPFMRVEDFQDSNKVKVVLSENGNALYFSRASIPFDRDRKGDIDEAWLKANRPLWHLGMYAYRAEFLKAFTQLPMGRLEALEKLEQLRALENGYRIGVGITTQTTVGIDTPDDVIGFESALKAEI